MIDEPKTNWITDHIIFAFYRMHRQRRYAQAMPLPLSVVDINAYTQAYPQPMPRLQFDSVIFALDDAWLESIRKK